MENRELKRWEEGNVLCILQLELNADINISGQ
jgi:hypothetical protein